MMNKEFSQYSILWSALCNYLSFINRHNKFDIYYWVSIHIDRIQEMN